MPELMTVRPDYDNGTEIPVATEDELIAFCNAARAAGGADPIKGLKNGATLNSARCVIARSLNFDSDVMVWRTSPNGESCRWPSGAAKWVMRPHDPSLAVRIASGIESLVVTAIAPKKDVGAIDWETVEAVLLPEEIGNAAFAFDTGLRFNEFRDDNLIFLPTKPRPVVEIPDPPEPV